MISAAASTGGCDEPELGAPFVKFRQLVAAAVPFDDAFFEEVLGKPKG